MLDLGNPADLQYREAQRVMRQARRRTRLETAALLGTPAVLLALLAAASLAGSPAVQVGLGCAALVGALLWLLRFFS